MSALPEDWRCLTLGDVARWGSGGTPTAGRSDYYDNGDIPWVVIGDLRDGHVESTQSRITHRALAESSAKLVPPGAVLVAMYGSIGKLGLTEFELATNQAIAFAVPHGFVTDRYLFWYLMSQRERIAAAGKGATQKNIGQGTLKSWPIPVPPLDEQRRIVDILEDHLSRLDAAHGASESARGKLASLEDSAITGVLLPASGDGNVVRRIVEGERPLLSHGWRWEHLGALAEIVSGVTKDAKKQSDPGLIEVPYLRVANVQRAHLDLSRITTIRVRPAVAETLALKRGDVLMNEGGDRDKLARGWVWEDQISGCIHQNHVHRARPDRTIVEPEWLAWCANTFGARWAQRHGRQSVNLASISRSTLLTMPIPVPPLDDQCRALASIAHLRDDVARMRLAVDAALVRSSSLRRALLAAAFSGRLTGRPSDLDIAEELMPA